MEMLLKSTKIHLCDNDTSSFYDFVCKNILIKSSSLFAAKALVNNALLTVLTILIVSPSPFLPRNGAN